MRTMSAVKMGPSPASEFVVVDALKVPLVKLTLLTTGVCKELANHAAIMPAIMRSIRRATNLTPTLRYCSGAGSHFRRWGNFICHSFTSLWLCCLIACFVGKNLWIGYKHTSLLVAICDILANRFIKKVKTGSTREKHNCPLREHASCIRRVLRHLLGNIPILDNLVTAETEKMDLS